MNLTTQKRLAADILKCGLSRVRVKEAKEVEEALTREDVRGLISQGLIWKIQKKGTSRGKARLLLKQKARGRRRGSGSKKGHHAEGKRDWVLRIRAQRRLLSELRAAKELELGEYRLIYRRAKGGMFRNKKHMLSYLKEHDLLQSTPGLPDRNEQSSQARRGKP